jgi:hypothetical protein
VCLAYLPTFSVFFAARSHDPHPDPQRSDIHEHLWNFFGAKAASALSPKPAPLRPDILDAAASGRSLALISSLPPVRRAGRDKKGGTQGSKRRRDPADYAAPEPKGRIWQPGRGGSCCPVRALLLRGFLARTDRPARRMRVSRTKACRRPDWRRGFELMHDSGRLSAGGWNAR